MSSDCRHHRTACRRGDLVGVSPRRATSVTTARGARLSATIDRFCSALHRRRRSGPVMTSTLAIAPSLAPVQTLLLAPVLPARPASATQDGLHRTGTVPRPNRRNTYSAGNLVEPDPRP